MKRPHPLRRLREIATREPYRLDVGNRRDPGPVVDLTVYDQPIPVQADEPDRAKPAT